MGRILIGLLALCTLAAVPPSPDPRLNLGPRLRLGPLLYSDELQHGLGQWIIEAEQPAPSDWWPRVTSHRLISVTRTSRE
jgi:hypothetical protein